MGPLCDGKMAAIPGRRTPGRKWWLFWPAASLALVSACYLGVGADGFQKRSTGTHRLGSRLLLWPYRAGAWLNARAWTRGQAGSAAVAGGPSGSAACRCRGSRTSTA